MQVVWGAASTLPTATQEDEEEPKEGPQRPGGEVGFSPRAPEAGAGGGLTCTMSLPQLAAGSSPQRARVGREPSRSQVTVKSRTKVEEPQRSP